MRLYLILVCVSVSLNCAIAHADKESEKGRLDDCYADLIDLGNEMNAANLAQSSNAPAFNVKFLNKKSRCNALQSQYEKKYGKYSIPRPKEDTEVESDRKNLSTLKDIICSTRDQVSYHEVPDLSGVPAKERDDNETQQISNGKKDLARYLDRFKRATGKTFESDTVCGPEIKTPEEKEVILGLTDKVRITDPKEKFGLAICDLQKALDDDPSGEKTSPNTVASIRRQLVGLSSFYKRKSNQDFDVNSCKQLQLDTLTSYGCNIKAGIPQLQAQNPAYVPVVEKKLQKIAEAYKELSGGKEVSYSNCK